MWRHDGETAPRGCDLCARGPHRCDECDVNDRRRPIQGKNPAPIGPASPQWYLIGVVPLSAVALVVLVVFVHGLRIRERRAVERLRKQGIPAAGFTWLMGFPATDKGALRHLQEGNLHHLVKFFCDRFKTRTFAGQFGRAPIVATLDPGMYEAAIRAFATFPNRSTDGLDLGPTARDTEIMKRTILCERDVDQWKRTRGLWTYWVSHALQGAQQPAQSTPALLSASAAALSVLATRLAPLVIPPGLQRQLPALLRAGHVPGGGAAGAGHQRPRRQGRLLRRHPRAQAAGAGRGGAHGVRHRLPDASAGHAQRAAVQQVPLRGPEAGRGGIPESQ